MDGYAAFFVYNDIPYKLPVNPEEIEVTSTQAIEKYEILKLGQIAVPTHMELKEYSFETEFPLKRGGVIPSYVHNPDEFHNPEYFLNRFEKWRSKLVPIQFIAGRFTNSEAELESDSISTLVLIEELTITEKAGEEGDKYVSFKLLEYRPFGKKTPDEIKITSEIGTKAKAKKKKGTTSTTNPKSTGYHIVRSGDNLWTIAKKYYGDGSKSNIIYNANKSKIKNPAIINIGRELKIPTKDEFSKYSAPLPVMKTEVKAPVYRGGPQGIAGIGSTLENYYG